VGDDFITVGNHLDASQAANVRSYIAGKGITSAVVAGYESDYFTGALNELASPETEGGVVVYHFTQTPPSCIPTG